VAVCYCAPATIVTQQEAAGAVTTWDGHKEAAATTSKSLLNIEPPNDIIHNIQRRDERCGTNQCDSCEN
jgi:hypothetical protein